MRIILFHENNKNTIKVKLRNVEYISCIILLDFLVITFKYEIYLIKNQY